MQAIPFPYQTNVVSQKQFETHLTLYNKAIDAESRIENKLRPPLWPDANTIDSEYRALQVARVYATNSAVLHEAYFRNMSNGNGQPGESTLRLLHTGFGSFENWQSDFTACALSARGWCVTVYNQRLQKPVNNLMDAHDTGAMVLAFPLIVLDMYEHAYFMDDGADKNAYVKRFLAGIDWDIVEARAWEVMSILDR